MSRPGDDVGEVVHAAIHPSPGHEQRDGDTQDDRDDADDGVVESRREQAGEARRTWRRRGRVSGRVARVDRQALQTLDIRVARARRSATYAIGADSTATTNTTNAARIQRRMIRKVTRLIPMTAGITCPPDRVEPTHEMSSCVGERLSASHWLKSSSASWSPPIGQQHVDQEQPEEHHRRHEQCVPREQRDDEDANRVLRAEPLGEPVGEPVRARLEHRRDGPPRGRSSSSRASR